MSPSGADRGSERPAPLPVVELRRLRVHAVTEDECVGHVMAELDAGRGGWVVTPNLDHLRRLSHDGALRQTYSRATLSVADGRPLVWASRLQGTPIPERVAGSSLIYTLNAAAAAHGRSVFLLGGNPGTAEAAAAVLTERYPGLCVAGTLCPPLGFEDSPERMAEIEAALEQAQPDVVFVALGFPKQELLIERLRERWPRTWWLGVGISFSFVAGEVRRAPRWMQVSGLEWAHRLGQEPRRLFRRYLVEGVPFALVLLAGSAGLGLRRAVRRG